MPTAVTLDVLPARFGDCLLVECHRDGDRPWRALVDGGPSDCWPALRSRLLELPADDRVLDLVVVTHIDADHIAGAIRFFEQGDAAVPGLRIADVWFNGLPMLPESESGPRRSVTQGEDLVALLGGARPGGALPWNGAFGGAAAMTPDQGESIEIQVPGGPRLTLLSPTPKRLVFLREDWVDALDRLQRGEPDDVVLPPVPPRDLARLEELAAVRSPRDASRANGSSIAFLLEHRGVSCLLTGDAFANVLTEALQGLAAARGTTAVEVDLFKLPHHASKGNVTATLIGLAPATHYVVSTNGDRFGHPDDEALARVLVAPSAGDRVLWFNYRTDRTDRWADPDLQATRRFTARFPDPGRDGLRIELPAADRVPIP
jgi:hypothetical protein